MGRLACARSASANHVAAYALVSSRPRSHTTAGGLFLMRLQFPDQYPDKAPRVKFISEVRRARASTPFHAAH